MHVSTGQPFLGESAAMLRIRELIDRIAGIGATILIRGETGTGKELVADAIHRASERRGPLVSVHCAALPDLLLESELFGHERGAFTGADVRKMGRVELAEGGTLFLDEIGDITPATQVKLLRLLQQREYQRLGSSTTRAADVRFIAATHCDLESMVAAGTFREDLYYRLHVVPIQVPPLRERERDVALLARHFGQRMAEEIGRPEVRLSDAAITRLSAAAWPGNVRQLQNVVQRLVVLCPGDEVAASAVDAELSGGSHASHGAVVRLGEAVRTAERAAIAHALRSTSGNRAEAARLLGVSRATFYNKLREHRIA